jgi:hypothetical protein
MGNLENLFDKELIKLARNTLLIIYSHIDNIDFTSN